MPPTPSALLRLLRALDENDVLPDHHNIDPEDTSCPIGRTFGEWRRAGYPGAEPLPTPRYKLIVGPDPAPESPADWLDGDTRCFIEARHRSFTARLSEKQAEVLSFGRYQRVPLFAYIHGGVHLFLREGDAERAAGSHAGWDTCQVGWMFIGPADAENPDPDKLAADIVEAWNMYLSGDVWCWRVIDTHDADEVVESLSNCYGEDSAREEGEAALASLLADATPPLVDETAYAACMSALSDPSGPRNP